MFRDWVARPPYMIRNRAFIQFVEQLEVEEGIELETFQVGKDKLIITTIEPDPSKMDRDIALPVLSPILPGRRPWRKR